MQCEEGRALRLAPAHTSHLCQTENVQIFSHKTPATRVISDGENKYNIHFTELLLVSIYIHVYILYAYRSIYIYAYSFFPHLSDVLVT